VVTFSLPLFLAGNAETLKIYITHVHKYDLWVLGVWPVQKRKGLRCVSRTVYERTVAKLSRLLQQSKSGHAEGEGERQFVAPTMAELTILNAPAPPPPPDRVSAAKQRAAQRQLARQAEPQSQALVVRQGSTFAPS
jgi:hypothetical protein